MAVNLAGSPYLDRLLSDANRLLHLLPPPKNDGDVDRFVAALLTLDGAHPDTIPTVTDATTVLASSVTATAGYDAKPGSWQQTLRLSGNTDDDVRLLRAKEVSGIADATGLQPVRPAQDFLTRVHQRLTDGLVASERHGQFREHDVAVHDSGTGRVLYQPSRPEQIPSGFDTLTALIDHPTYEPLVTAALVVYQCHVVQPFDAANGRMGLVVARLIIDTPHPGGVPFESRLANDRAGFHTEIAQTLRRNDATYFVERYVEAFTLALRETARKHGVLDAAPKLSAPVLATLTSQPTLTVKDLNEDVIAVLVDAGVLTPVAGMHGLRYVSHLAREPR